jgi:cytochrome c-type biogenesis protein CcmE
MKTGTVQGGPTEMEGRKLKFALFAAGIVVSMAVLLYAAINQDGGGLAFYMTVEEFLDNPPEGNNFRVNGKVKEGSIDRLPTGLDVAFVVTDGQRDLPVVYHGIIADTFVDGADVVVEGAMGGEGQFVASTMLAKCPSKYESADGEHPEDVPYGSQPN